MTQIIQRIFSIIFYCYPLKVSLFFGDALFTKYYFLKVIFFYLTLPINLIEIIFTYGGLRGLSGLIIFLMIFAGIVKNYRVPYFVRFNACQALLLYIALIILIYLLSLFPFPTGVLGSIIFLISCFLFILSVFKCMNGIEPEIPFISKSVRMQI